MQMESPVFITLTALLWGQLSKEIPERKYQTGPTFGPPTANFEGLRRGLLSSFALLGLYWLRRRGRHLWAVSSVAFGLLMVCIVQFWLRKHLQTHKDMTEGDYSLRLSGCGKLREHFDELTLEVLVYCSFSVFQLCLVDSNRSFA